MRDSRSLVAVRTYALAFAVALSPAFFQTAYSCERGDTFLLSLELEVFGQDQIANFSVTNRSYAVATSSSTAILRVVTKDPDSIATYRWFAGGTAIGPSMEVGVGGGEVTVTVPDGQTALYVGVRAPEGAADNYIVDVDRIPPVLYSCDEQGILDAIAAGGLGTFDCPGPTTITTSTELVLSSNVMLDGGGLLTVDGNGAHRVFSVPSGVTAEFIGLTITRGGGALGNGIYNEGTLTVANSTVSENDGGGIINTGTLIVWESEIVENTNGVSGGGITNSGSLTVKDSAIVDNTSQWNGGVGNLAPAATANISRTMISGNQATTGSDGGIGVGAGCELMLTDSMVGGNQAADSGGGIGSGDASTVTVVNSSVTGNTAAASAGGIGAAGILVVTNSTVSGNTAAVSAGGIAVDSTGTATVTSSTVTGNTSPLGGAIGTLGSLTLASTIIDGDCAILGPPLSATYTIESPDSTCGLPGGQDNQMGVSPAALDLGPLQYNGGMSLSHAPNEGSVVIDAIPVGQGGYCTESTDQVGATRPQRSSCDIGAVELAPYVGVCGDGTLDPGEGCEPPDEVLCTSECLLVGDDGSCAGLPDMSPCDFGAGIGSCEGEVCRPVASCASNEDCDDSQECTDEYCDAILACVSSPLPDGAPCAGGSGVCQGGNCDPRGPVGCSIDTECDDQYDCTTDWCDGAICAHVAAPDGAPCESGTRICRAGICSAQQEWYEIPQTVWASSQFGEVRELDIAADAAGRTVLAWLTVLPHPNGQDNFSMIGLANYDADAGSWEFVYGPFSWTQRFRNLRVALGPNGDVMLVWVNGSQIVSGRYSTVEGRWLETYLEVGNHDSPRQVEFEVDAAGNAIAVWSWDVTFLYPPPNNPYERQVRRLEAGRYTPGTGWQQGNHRLNLGFEIRHPSEFQMAMNESGDAIVVADSLGADFMLYDPILHWIAAQHYDAGLGWPGGWGYPRFINGPLGAASTDKSQVDVAMDQSGNAVAVWTAWTPAPPGVPVPFANDSSLLFVSHYEAEGVNTWFGANPLQYQKDFPNYEWAYRGPQVAMTNNSTGTATAMVAYEAVELGFPFFSWEGNDYVEAATHNMHTLSGWWKKGFSPPLAAESQPQVAMGGNSEDWAIVAKSGQDIVAVTRDHQRRIIGSAPSAGPPVVAVDGNGVATAAWWESDGSESRIMVNQYDPHLTFPCTNDGLRAAIAAGGGPHPFACGASTRVMTDGELVIDKDVILDGQGGLIVDGGGTHRVFSVTEGTTARLEGMTITGGLVTGDGYADFGGGIYNEGDLLLLRANVSGNVVSSTGNALGGGVYNAGTLTVAYSSVSGNVLASLGGGSAIMTEGEACNIINSTISSNEGENGDPAAVHARLGPGAQLTITSTTVSDNIGRGVYADVYPPGSQGNVTIANSTISGNSRQGIILGQYGPVNLRVTSSTLTGNDASQNGYALQHGSTHNGSTIELANSIVEGVCSLGLAPSATYTIESPGTTCNLPAGQNNLMGVSPIGPNGLNLGPLQDNGGPTLTHAPDTVPDRSIAVDFIPEVDCVDLAGDPVTIDQRGWPRPNDTVCDVGAVEVETP